MRKICNIFRFTNDLNSITDGEKFNFVVSLLRNQGKSNGKKTGKNTNKLEAIVLHLEIKIKNGKFQLSTLKKRDLFPFSIVRMQVFVHKSF